MDSVYHKPVMLQACLDGLAIQPNGVYVDATFGGGGHSRAILEKLDAKGRLYAFDQDPDARANVLPDKRFTLIPLNFSEIKNALEVRGVEKVDGVLADLGVSSHQFDKPERGFSYRFDAPLDMRMNRTDERTAAFFLNDLDKAELRELLANYGEIQHAGKLAAAIVKERENKPFETTFELNRMVEEVFPREKDFMGLLSQVYQALRIAVNDEVNVLKEFLADAIEVLKPGGRLAVISYHSIEDGLAKHFINTGNAAGERITDFYGNPISPIEPLTRKPLVPTRDEVAENPRSRSAKLRIGRKK